MLLYLHFTNLTTWHVYLSKVWKRKEKYVVLSTLYIFNYMACLCKVWKREKKYIVISTFYII